MTAQMRMVVSIIVDHAPATGVEEAAMRRMLASLIKRPGVHTEWLDLRDFPLPPCEYRGWHPKPVASAREDAIVKRWKAAVARSDAFIFHVTPEHDGNPPATLVNALEWAHPSWKDKAAAFVSDGRQVSWRLVQELRAKAATVRMIGARSALRMPASLSGGCNEGDETIEELLWWTQMLKAMREERQRVRYTDLKLCS